MPRVHKRGWGPGQAGPGRAGSWEDGNQRLTLPLKMADSGAGGAGGAGVVAGDGGAGDASGDHGGRGGSTWSRGGGRKRAGAKRSNQTLAEGRRRATGNKAPQKRYFRQRAHVNPLSKNEGFQ
jgi:hypothetical protein